MRGRKPAGPEYVDRLTGSDTAKERLHVVLETLAGRCRVQEACARLNLSEPRFHQLRTQILQAGLDSLAPRPAGRPPRPAPDERVQALEATVADLTVELQAAHVREEIALALPQVGSPAAAKKASGRRPSPRRRRPSRS
jgi:helix-turn-helix protein